MTRSKISLGIALAFSGIYLIWGTTYLAIAIAIETLPPFTSGAIRFLLAAALMFVWLRSKAPTPFAGIDWRLACVCGGLLSGAGNGLVIWAQQGVPSGIAALIFASIPVFVLAIDWLFFARRSPTPSAAIGISLALLGVAVIVTHTGSLSGHVNPLHIAALLLGVFVWSLGTLIQKWRVPSAQVIAFTCAQIFFGGLWQFVFSLLNREWQVFDASQVSTRSLLALLYLTVFGSIVAFNCYAWLLVRIDAQKVATYALVNPVVALGLGAWLLGERITPTVIASVLLVLAGISLVLFRNGASEAEGRLVRPTEVRDVR